MTIFKMRPVPAARSHGPHQPSLSDALQAAGYTLGPSPYAGKRLLSHRGVPVGHYSAAEAGEAFRDDVDRALADLADGVNASLGLPPVAPLPPLQARKAAIGPYAG